MKTILSILGAGLFLAGAGVCQASLIAAWDFHGVAAAPNTPGTFAATVGSGTIDDSAFVAATERTTFTGTATVNPFSGGESVTGTALALFNQTANGKSLIISASMSGYQGLVVSYATQRTSTGFNEQDWSYSTDGGATYSSIFASITAIPSAFGIETVDFSSISALNGDASVFLKLTLSGASSASGNNRFDNIQLNATAVPEPGEWGLISAVGLLGICSISTWRRHCATRRVALARLRN